MIELLLAMLMIVLLIVLTIDISLRVINLIRVLKKNDSQPKEVDQRQLEMAKRRQREFENFMTYTGDKQ